MSKKVEKILQELYEINPSLKDDKKLERVVENMLLLKPKVKVDTDFKRELRKRINLEIIQNKYDKSDKLSGLQIFKYIFSWLVVTSVWFFSLLNIGFFDNFMKVDKGTIIDANLPTNLATWSSNKPTTDMTNEVTQNNMDEVSLKKEIPEIKKTDKKVELPQNKDNLRSVDAPQEKIVPESTSDKVNTSEKPDDFVFPQEAYDVLFPTNNSDSSIVPSWEDQSMTTSWEWAGMMQKSLMMDSFSTQSVSDKYIFVEKVKSLKIDSADLSYVTEDNTWSIVVSENINYGMTFYIDYDSMYINITKNPSYWAEKEWTWTLLSNTEISDILNTFISKYNLWLSTDFMDIKQNNHENVILFLSQVKVVIDTKEKKVTWVYNY